jgi:SpoVK/Ycf46/Vps4 family AAA+-type ATPase
MNILNKNTPNPIQTETTRLIGNEILRKLKYRIEKDIIERIINGEPIINIITEEHGRSVRLIKRIIEEANKIQDIFRVFVVPFNIRPINGEPFSTSNLIEVYKSETKKTFNPQKEKLIIIDTNADQRLKVDPYFLPALIHQSLPNIEINTQSQSLLPFSSLSITYITISNQKFDVDTIFNYILPPPTEEELKESLEISYNLFKEKDPSVNLTEQEKKKIIHEAKGLYLFQAERAFSSLLRTLSMEKVLDISKITEYKKQELLKAGLELVKPIDINQVGGLHNLKEYLYKIQKTFEKIRTEEQVPGIKEIPKPKGLLLTGVPGAGKSLTAKALGSLLNMQIVRLDTSKIFSKYVGETEQNFQRMLKTIEAMSPIILFIDEIEKALSSGHEVSNRILGMFLTWLQEQEGLVYTVATANKVNLLPVELLRAGRWDALFYFDLPTEEERYEIAKIHLDKYFESYSKEILQEIVESTENYTGSEIEQIIKEYAIEKINHEDTNIKEITNRVKPMAETLKEELEAIRELEKRGFIKANAKTLKTESTIHGII